MSKTRLSVQHWVMCHEARTVPPVSPSNAYDLFRVGYYNWADADTEFPWVLPQLSMYVRLVNGVGKAAFEVRVQWLGAPRARRRTTTYGPHVVTFRPGQPVRDTLFRLRNVPFDGEGLHRFQLVRLADQKALLLATEYISVGRST